MSFYGPAVRVQVKRQDNTTNSDKPNSVILTGIGVIAGASSTVVTFGVTFAEVPVILTAEAGGSAVSAAYAYPSSNSFTDRVISTFSQSTTGFTATISGTAPTASQSAIFTWIAIGSL